MSKKILVIDDHADSLQLLRILLKKSGHEVTTASSGAEGLKAFEDGSPDCVLLDISLPDMSGYAVCAAIRALPQGQGTLIIAQTGWGSEEDIARSKAAGFDFHLVKPIPLAELQSIISNYRGR